MARELRRLWIAPERLAPRLALAAQESHYLTRVLRLHRGERLAVIDGAGGLWSATLEGPDTLLLDQPVANPLQRAAAPERRLTLALAVPKREAELVWRMAVELGATHLQPLLARRGVVRQGMPLQRWRAIVKEATEQCERLWLPELAEPQSSEAWFGTPRPGLALLACPGQEGRVGLSSLEPAAPAAQVHGLHEKGSAAAMAGRAALGGGAEEITLAIGPEGGWSPEEEAMALGAGWQPLQLGPTILRTSTAAVAGLALVALG